MGDAVVMRTEFPEVLLQFKAGLMSKSGSSVKADPRKGKLRLIRMEDGLLHCQWIDRDSNSVEIDQIVFPNEAKFERVSQASGRVYLLRFAFDERRFFFWMQEPKSTHDEAISNQMNEILSDSTWMDDVDTLLATAEEDATHAEMSTANIPRSSQMPVLEGQAPTPSLSTSLPNPPLHPTLTPPSNLSPGARNQAPPPAASSQPASDVSNSHVSIAHADVNSSMGRRNVVELAQLQSILASLSSSSSSSPSPSLSPFPYFLPQTATASSNNSSAVADHLGLSLSDVLKPDNLIPFLNEESVRERLAPHLPEALQSFEAMVELVRSPQFQQQLDSLTELLRAGKIDLSQFGVNSAEYGFSIISFLKAIQDQAKKGQESSS